MNMMKSIVVLGISLFSVALSAADFTVYWSTDGAASEGVSDLAQQFQSALKSEAGIDARVVVANAAKVSQVAAQQQVDMLITCNEVDSSHGAPVLRLSDQEIKNLSCVGGSNKGQWSLASDQDVDRHNSGEYWVYFMRSSQHFDQFRDVREAMQSIKQQLQIDSIITASAK